MNRRNIGVSFAVSGLGALVLILATMPSPDRARGERAGIAPCAFGPTLARVASGAPPAKGASRLARHGASIPRMARLAPEPRPAPPLELEALVQRQRRLTESSADPARRMREFADRDPALVLLKSGHFRPEVGAPVRVEGQEAHVLVQFRGPPTVAQREELARAGIVLGRYIPNTTWVARVPAASLQALTQRPFVAAVANLSPRDRVAVLGPKGLARWPEAFDGSRHRLDVTLEPDVDLERGKTALLAAGALSAESLRGRPGVLRISLDAAALSSIVALDEVAWCEPPPPKRVLLGGPAPSSGTSGNAGKAPPALHNVTAAERSNVTPLRGPPFDLDGSGVKVGVWDGGAIDAAHPELSGRVTVVRQAEVSDHATHVAGTVAARGVDPSALGMAPAAQLYSFHFFDEPINEMRQYGPQLGLAQSTNSWGLVVDETTLPLLGAYTSDSVLFDTTVEETGLLVTKSAGNAQADSETGYDTVDTGSVAKNLLCIGATDDDDAISDFSSLGPADDGRVKPDVVANGVGLYSSWPGGSYLSISGTSMSNPAVAGQLALLVQLFIRATGRPPAPSLARALLINSANDVELGPRAQHGPDYATGFGLTDAQELVALARDQLTASLATAPRYFTSGTASQDSESSYSFTIRAGQPDVRVTLAWTDPPGDPAASKALVDDLDLALAGPDGRTYLPWTLDGSQPTWPATRRVNSVDNVEQVSLEQQEVLDGGGQWAGIWQIRVKGARIPAVGSQSYHLASNVSLRVSGSSDQPRLALVDPKPLETASGSVAVVAEVSAAAGISFVQYRVDLSSWHAMVPAAAGGTRYESLVPFEARAGDQTLEVRAVDRAGGTAQVSATVSGGVDDHPDIPRLTRAPRDRLELGAAATHGQLEVGGDVDCFLVSIPFAGSIRVEATADSTIELGVDTLAFDGMTSLSQGAAFPGSPSTAEVFVEPGDQFVRVSGSWPGGYSVRATVLSTVGRPNLVASRLSGMTAATAGTLLGFAVTVANASPTRTDNAGRQALYFSRSATPTASDSLLATAVLGALPARASIAVDYTATIPEVEPGRYFLHHVSDDLRQLAETREQDNVATLPFTVAGPDDHPGSAAEVQSPRDAVPLDGEPIVCGVSLPQDQDYFFVDVPYSGTFRFQTELISLPDTVLALFDTDGVTLLREVDDTETSRAAALDLELAPGRYYLRVKGYGGSLGSYTLQATTIRGAPAGRNLRASNLRGPTFATPGSSVHFSVVVSNTSSTEPCTGGVQVLRLVPDGAESAVAETSRSVGLLTPGQTTEVAYDLVVPPSLPAWESVTFRHRSDALDHVEEVLETDNEASARVLIGAAPQPDDHADTVQGVQDPRDRLTIGAAAVTGDNETSSDVDLFFVDVASAGSYFFESRLDTHTGTVLALIGTDGATLLAVDGDRERSAAGVTGDLSPGRYYLRVTGFQGRTGSYTLSAVGAGQPNLRAIGIDGPRGVSPGELVSFTARVRNASATPTANSGLQLLSLSTQATGAGTEAVVLSTMPLGPLGAGETALVTHVARIPPLPDGEYFLLHWTDDDGRVAESDETDNGTAVSLSLSSQDDHPETAVGVRDPADRVSLGGQAAAGSLDAAFDRDFFFVDVSGPGRYAFETQLTGNSDTVLALLDGDGTTVLAENDDFRGRASRVEAQLTAGRYYLKVSGFIGLSLGAYTLSAVSLSEPAILPNLVTSLAEPPSQVSPGDSLLVTATVANSGTTTAATGGTRVLSLRATSGSSSSLWILGQQRVESLAPGTVVSASYQVTIPPAVAAGAYDLVHTVDADGEVTEINENDNWSSARLVVRGPDDHPDSSHQTRDPEDRLSLGGQSALGEIETFGDRDAFLMDVAAEADCRIETRLRTLADSVLFLYGSDGVTLLAQNDDTVGLASRIEVHLTPGRYYVTVIGYGGESRGSYSVSARDLSTRLSGANLAAGELTGPRSGVPGASIEFVVSVTNESSTTLPDGGSQVLRLESHPAGTPTTARVLATATLGSLLPGQTTVLTYRTVVPELPSGPYQLRHRSDDGAAIAEVDEFDNVAETTFIVRGEDDHPDVARGVRDPEDHLLIGTPASGLLADLADVDVFSVDLPESGLYRFSTSLGTNNDTLLELLGGDGATRLDFNDDFEGRASRIVKFLEAGRYYLAVSGYQGSVGTFGLRCERQSSSILHLNAGVNIVSMPIDAVTTAGESFGPDALAAAVRATFVASYEAGGGGSGAFRVRTGPHGPGRPAAPGQAYLLAVPAAVDVLLTGFPWNATQRVGSLTPPIALVGTFAGVSEADTLGQLAERLGAPVLFYSEPVPGGRGRFSIFMPGVTPDRPLVVGAGYLAPVSGERTVGLTPSP